MNIFRGTDFSHRLKHPVVTVGTFDGVHKGHQALLAKMKKIAEETDGEALVITFNQHPRLILNTDNDVFFLNTIEEKIKLIENAGIENLWILPFTKSFARLSAEKFIKDFLVHKAGVDNLLVGYDHSLGKGGTTSFDNLKNLADNFGFAVRKIEKVIIEGKTASSSVIRKALINGNIETANMLLGYNYMLSGRVKIGNQIGHKIGFPTANLKYINRRKLIPAIGVYACKIEWDGQIYNAMSNVGFRPTVNSNHLNIEAHIFDFDRDIYDDPITISFVQRIRDEQKFDGLEQLKAQLIKDKEVVLKVLKSV